MRRLLSTLAVLAALAPAGAHAQLAMVADAPAAPAAIAAEAPAAGSASISLTAAGRAALADVRAEAAAKAVAPSAKGGSFGRPEALMIVGGAAIIGGLLVGGDVGYVVSVAGLGVGLYGLWEYLK